MTAPTKRDYSATAAVFQQLADKQDQAAKLLRVKAGGCEAA
jgi:hypothetical protein